MRQPSYILASSALLVSTATAARSSGLNLTEIADHLISSLNSTATYTHSIMSCMSVVELGKCSMNVTCNPFDQDCRCRSSKHLYGECLSAERMANCTTEVRKMRDERFDDFKEQCSKVLDESDAAQQSSASTVSMAVAGMSTVALSWLMTML